MKQSDTTIPAAQTPTHGTPARLRHRAARLLAGLVVATCLGGCPNAALLAADGEAGPVAGSGAAPEGFQLLTGARSIPMPGVARSYGEPVAMGYGEVDLACGYGGGCEPLAGPGAGEADCCEASDTPGCGNPSIEACVCEHDSACCDPVSGSWDPLCVVAAVDYGCAVCE